MPPRKKARRNCKPNMKTVTCVPISDVPQEASKSLANFPIELQRMIVKNLQDDHVSSICLGLACKAFMDRHKEFHKQPVHLWSYTFTSEGEGKFLKGLLQAWFPQNLIHNYGRFTKPEVEISQGKKFDQAFAIEEHNFAIKAERDMDRIANRKLDRRRLGFYVDKDQWSNFSALSGDLDDDFYEPTEGTCDGDSLHSRAFYLDAEDELLEERRAMRHMEGEYSSHSSAESSRDNSGAGSRDGDSDSEHPETRQFGS